LISGPTHTDVLIAGTGASAALAGLVLVFLGVVLTTYQELLGRENIDATLKRLKNAAKVTLGVFCISLASLVLDVTWLVASGGNCFYRASVVLFFVQLGAVAVGAIWTTLGVLLKG
jgi:hypothetical protein